MNELERQGHDAFRRGEPFDPSKNIDWIRGRQNAADDARSDMEAE